MTVTEGLSAEYVSKARYDEATTLLQTALAEAEDLRRQLQRHQADRAIIGEELLSEAEMRTWCDEYNTFVDRVNARLSTPWLKHYLREIDITYRVRVQGRARNLDNAYEEIYSQLQEITIESDNGEITGVDVQA